MESAGTEISFEPAGTDAPHAKLRLVHFNVNRKATDPFFIIGNANSKIEIEAPYAKKRYFKPDSERERSSLVLTVGNTSDAKESLTFQ